MRWDVVQQGLLDELTKISEVSLAGLPPSSVMSKMQPAPPLETPGLSKALAVLSRYEQTTAQPKLASAVVSKGGVATVTTSEKGKKKRVHILVAEPAKSLGAHTIGGAAGGKFLAELAQKNHISSPSLRRAGKWGAGVGAVLGAGEFARKKLLQQKTKKAGVFGVLRKDPHTEDLNRAFAAYRKDTGKDPKTMSFDDIEKYLGKTKKAAVAALGSPKLALRASQAVAKPKIGFHKGSPHLSTIGAGSTIGRRFQVPM